ncbi:MAG: response regulator [Candidatus Omnitrophica bacterium]|nr:response regulator [Candidatus Omnitrophota bacterium]
MRKKRILVVDDEPGFLSLITEYFKSHQYEVFSAGNLEDAVSAFHKQAPGVVLLDFNMPIVNGDKFLPILQEVDPFIKVIVITGYTLENVEDKFKGLGYFAFFEKGGLALEKLKDKVDEALAY